MAKYDVLDIAKYFLNKEMFLSNKKLQKLVFYAYVWYLVRNNTSRNNIKNKLFDDNIEAWVHGPVCPKLYYAYNDNQIKKYMAKEIDKDTKEILDLIIDVYGAYNGNQLEELTHKEVPWQKARKDCLEYEICRNNIRDEDIYEYYSDQIR